MKKIFRKYIIIIMSLSLASLLLITYFLSTKTVESRRFDTFNLKIDQVVQSIENNQHELKLLKNSLDDDYLTRAKAFAYIIEKEPAILESVSELQKLSVLLDVDELHVSDSKGIIAYSSIPKYIGLDYHNGEQMSGFLPILYSDDPNVFVNQDAQPNTAESKIMKYVGVARKDKKGIVQVGLEPTRLLEAQRRNTYEYIFSLFPTNDSEVLFAIDKNTNKLITSSDKLTDEETSFFTYDNLKNCKSGDFKKIKNSDYYFVSREYDDILIGASVPKKVLFKNMPLELFLIGIYLLIVGGIVIISINVILDRKVLKGIHSVIHDLDKIKDGDLTTVVKADDNDELKDLSSGINSMVSSLVNSTDRISKIISLIDIPVAVFEYQTDTKQLFATSRLKELLHLNEEEFKLVYSNPILLLDTIKKILQKPVNGEKNIYQLKDNVYLRIRLNENETGFYGTVNDVSIDTINKQEIQYKSSHDHLTDLLLYTSFKHIASNIINHSKTNQLYAAVMLDLDSFKTINDIYGHDFGDYYLQCLTNVLNKLSKDHCLLGRRSGDEFCLFIYNCESKENITKYLELLWSYFKEEDIRLPNQSYTSLKVSGGFVCGVGANNNIDDLMKKADEALYNAKNYYKGYYVEYQNNNKLDI